MKNTINEHIKKLDDSFINELESIHKSTTDPETRKILEKELNEAKLRLKNNDYCNTNNIQPSKIHDPDGSFEKAINQHQQELEKFNKIKKYVDMIPLIKMRLYITILFGLIIYGLYKYA